MTSLHLWYVTAMRRRGVRKLHPAALGCDPPLVPFVPSSGAYKNSMVWCCVNKLWSDVVSKNVKTIENLYFTFCPIFIKDLRWVTKTITCCLHRCVRRTHFEMSATPTITFCQRKWREMKCPLTSYRDVVRLSEVRVATEKNKNSIYYFHDLHLTTRVVYVRILQCTLNSQYCASYNIHNMLKSLGSPNHSLKPQQQRLTVSNALSTANTMAKQLALRTRTWPKLLWAY